MTRPLRLGVNIDHVATIRNARGGMHPDPVRAAKLAEECGADGITAHLREDRRHISDEDITRLVNTINIPLNFEMAATREMLEIALRHTPHAACIVPEKRQERTTEGGLDAVGGHDHLAPFINDLGKSGIRVSLFVEPNRDQLNAAKSLGAPVVELHVGAYCDSSGNEQERQFQRIVDAARYADEIGLECHAGHGLTYETVSPIAAIPSIVELNIGHFLIGEAIYVGLEESIKRMRQIMTEAREGASGLTE
ncbi:MAG: pyridoxine 5'-phosphate synthase [Rhodospirillales bacterium]|nr:pyridoxine 5'-phosphate synthase [Rhodospirillales bacterium]